MSVYPHRSYAIKKMFADLVTGTEAYIEGLINTAYSNDLVAYTIQSGLVNSPIAPYEKSSKFWSAIQGKVKTDGTDESRSSACSQHWQRCQRSNIYWQSLQIWLNSAAKMFLTQPPATLQEQFQGLTLVDPPAASNPLRGLMEQVQQNHPRLLEQALKSLP